MVSTLALRLAIDRRIDPERLIIPVSGTLIRQHLYENKHYLDLLFILPLSQRLFSSARHRLADKSN